MLLRIYLSSLLFFISSVANGESKATDRISATVAKYTSGDTLAVAVVEIDGQWVAGLQQLLVDQLGEQGNTFAGQPAFPMVRGFVESFRAAGAQELLVVTGLRDLSADRGPLGVLTADNTSQAASIQQMASGLLSMGPGDVKNLRAVVHETQVLIGQQATIDHYIGVAASERTDLQESIADMFDDPDEVKQPRAGLVLALGPQTRRVVRDLWPELPTPFDVADGPFVADDVKLISATLSCPPEWRTHMAVHTASEDAAATVEKLVDAAWRRLIEGLSSKPNQAQLVDLAQRASRVLAPERDGADVMIRASHDDREVGEMINSVLLPAIGSARDNARRAQRMNQFKQMALTMLNFESANGHMPASAAIVDKQGKPMLSWRVAVLPYTEQGGLYNEFRLDEPWDSSHNLKLVKSMPDIYADASHPELGREGKTTFQLPVHERSVFPPFANSAAINKRNHQGRVWHYVEGTRFRDITDGTSQTVMIVQTAPEDAVVWTKPADWEVDLARAWQQLKGDRTTGAMVSAFCDGSAHAWDYSEDSLAEKLPKLITRDGKEMIEW